MMIVGKSPNKEPYEKPTNKLAFQRSFTSAMDIATNWEVRKNKATREMQYARRRPILFLTKSVNIPMKITVLLVRV